MSENTKPQPPNEDVDVGQIFEYIEKFFKKIGELFTKLVNFFVWLLGKLAIFILLLFNVLLKRALPILALTIIGFAIPYLLDKYSSTTYEATMLLKQNYPTGKVLYENIDRYDELAKQGDSISLSNELKIDESDAGSLMRLKITGIVNNNKLLQDYQNHVKTIDSIFRPSFSEFKNQVDFYDTEIQEITVISSKQSTFNSLSSSIIDAINSNSYFLKEREKTLNNITEEIKTIDNIINKSDTLQRNYLNLLEKYYSVEEKENSQGTLSLNLNNANKEKINTREFDLFNEQVNRRLQKDKLIALFSAKQNIVELQKGFNTPVKSEGKFEGKSILVAIIFFLIALAFFVFRELQISEILKKYGSKDKFLE